MKVLKILFSCLSAASRDRRELSVVMDMGAEAVVMSKEETPGTPYCIEGPTVYHPTTRPLGNRFPAAINRIVSLFTWARFARKQHADIITGHDLPGMTAALLSTCFMRKSKRPYLVYDAHEFELGRTKRSRLATAFIRKYEKFVIKRSSFTIIPNQPIADEIVKQYRLSADKYPIVARNTPYNWELDDEVIANTRRALCEQLNVPDDTTITLYHGVVMPVRGVEVLLEATTMLENTAVVVLGRITDEYRSELKKKCEQLNIAERVLFLDPVPNYELWKYVGAADIGVISTLATVANCFFSTPNKLFENIQALTPLAASDLPIIKSIIEQYDVGLTFPAGDAKAMAEAIRRMRDDREMYARFKHNLLRAKEELCWENEKKPMQEAYRALFAKVNARKK